MITFFNLGIHGRLGNQLFQYAALRALSLKTGFESMIPDISQRNWHGQNCLLSNFKLESKTLSADDIKKIKYHVIQKDTFRYYPDIEEISDFSNLYGHFVHLDYFIKFKNEIFKEFSFRNEILAPEAQYMNSLREDNCELVSLHIRRGDNTDGTNPQFSSYYDDDPFNRRTDFGRYVTNSIDFFGSRNVKFVVFVGGSRTGDDSSEIRWAKEKFSDKKFIVSTSNNPISDFIRITLCDHNITSYCSTYSLWASYLNGSTEKTVICPENFWLIHPVDPEKHKIFMDHWNVL